MEGFGTSHDIRHNHRLFFVDSALFAPAMTLLSITAVVPYFLDQAGATTFQIGLAASSALICNLALQPVFGRIASHSRTPHRTFANVLLTQRVFFLAFVVCIPLFAGHGQVLVWAFLLSWAVFNLFVGSYSIFYTPLLMRLLPPDQRGAVRGLGAAAGSLVGLGAAALIPVVLSRVGFPLGYVLVFALGTVLLLVDAVLFRWMRPPANSEPSTPMSVVAYVKGMPATVRHNAPFRAVVVICMFLAVANSLLTYYTVYAIRVFAAAEAQIGILAALAVIAGVVGSVCSGFASDRWDPRAVVAVAAALVVLAGALALATHSLGFLYVAWVMANLANSGYAVSAVMLVGTVSPLAQLPLYAGVNSVVSLALSAAVLLLLAPALERVGFTPLFAIVLLCGAVSLLTNELALRRRVVSADP